MSEIVTALAGLGITIALAGAGIVAGVFSVNLQIGNLTAAVEQCQSAPFKEGQKP